ncbi:MAG: hypothetical protein WA843_00465 [Candidatus Saccharimonadales bacterium]
MSNRKFDEDEVQGLAGIIIERFEDQLKKLVESIDGRIEYHLRPLKEDVNTLKRDVVTIKIVIKATNQDIHSHHKQLKNLNTRVGRLEIARA